MRKAAYRCATIVAVFFVICVAALAQDNASDRSAQDRSAQDRSAQDRFAQGQFAQDRSLDELSKSQEQFGRERLGQDRLGQDRLGQDRFDRDRPRQERGQDRFDRGQDRFDQSRGGRNQPGDFDFYVLALSWSPSFCEASRERNGRPPQQQCGERPYSFVVHGLWPQYERGFPRECQIPAPRLSRNIVDTMLDLMPSPRLVFNQWDRHGTCSGLNAQQYFDTVRKARDSVRIPDQFKDISNYLMVRPDEVEQAFVDANPGLSRGAIAVTCDTRRLSEVRICMSRDLRFRDCAEVDRRACRNEKVVMPPVRGG